jgi:probable HAF family extracellular repeat protein
MKSTSIRRHPGLWTVWSLMLLGARSASADNQFTLIDYPSGTSTQAWAINSQGDIGGYYTGIDNNSHGFLFNGGNYAEINYPGASVTLINAINPHGDIVGEFGATATSPHRGFMLGADGVYAPFDFPGAVTTQLVGINASGEMSGVFILADGNRHSFLSVAGILTRIDYPGATQTGALGISPAGEVVGAYMAAGVAHGFVYSTGSGFTTINYPASTYTNVTGRNASGDVVGRYLDAAGVSHGYILSNGQFTNVDYPGASFTGLTAIDPTGNITGRCTVNGVTHGFVLASTRPPLRYSITDLGLVGASPGQPLALSNNGLVAGTVVTATGLPQAVVWSPAGVMTGLGSAGLNSIAFGINGSDLVVGRSEIPVQDPSGEDFCGTVAMGLPRTGVACAAFAAKYGTLRPLATLGGANATARAVNERGQIVGTAENATLDPTCPSPQKYQFKPVVWQGEEVQELPTTGGDPNGVAYGLNENGDIAGGSGNCAAYDTNNLWYFHPLHALLWQAGGVRDLGNLGGQGQFMGNFARLVNNLGEAVGWSDIAGDHATHAFRWTPNAGMQDLGTLAGDGHSIGLAINDQGVITGVSIAPDFSSLRAFVRRGGVMTDLNQLVPANSALYLLTACSINSRGEIIGFAVDGNGKLHGYLATSVGAE